jgi:hypothetical protein
MTSTITIIPAVNKPFFFALGEGTIGVGATGIGTTGGSTAVSSGTDTAGVYGTSLTGAIGCGVHDWGTSCGVAAWSGCVGGSISGNGVLVSSVGFGWF